MLIILSGLPGSGKTAIARELARQMGAVHVCIDSIEAAIRASGIIDASRSLNDAGYRAGYSIAVDNLRAGLPVIADSVNPIPLTRDAWVAVAKKAQVTAIEVEIACSDAGEHRRRVETRISETPGLILPTWDEVTCREYHRWDRKHFAIDTAGLTPDECVRLLLVSVPEVSEVIRDRTSAC